MELGDRILHELHEKAVNAAYLAGQLIIENMHNKIVPRNKISGDSLASQVVTEIDFLSQDIILKALLETIEKYDLGLLTEECYDNLSRLEKDFFWCIDPMDGTLSFIEATPGFSVSIALVSKSGESQIGVIYDPLKDNLYSAIKGNGCFKNGQRWNPSLGSLQKNQKIKVFIDRSMVETQLFNTTIKELEKFVAKNNLGGFELIKHGGAVMNACWILENNLACYFKFPKKEKGGGCLWDFAATSCLFNECSAIVSDIHGNSLDLNRHDSYYMNHNGVLYSNNYELAKFIMNLYVTSCNP